MTLIVKHEIREGVHHSEYEDEKLLAGWKTGIKVELTDDEGSPTHSLYVWKREKP